MSILFHHYKELKECISDVERIEGKVNSSKKKELTKKEEEKLEYEEEIPTTLDSYLRTRQIPNNIQLQIPHLLLINNICICLLFLPLE
jgi:hypothetical protein